MAFWKFKPYTEDDTRENPTQSQFFTTNEVKGIANGLVREGIQNALDEQLDKKKPVLIRITLSGQKHSLTPQQCDKYFDGLKEHLFSKDSGIRELPNFNDDKMNFIVFEDFNTKGLRGNPIESKDAEIEDGTKPHNFYYFWRNVGITGKPEDKLGRWGIGKTVFPASSRINTFFGYTIQCDTNDALLLGQTILKKHNIESQPEDWGYKAYGYFGNFDEKSYFAKPIIENEFLSTFKNEFLISRKNEPGLSIVIPFVKEQITRDFLLFAVIKQYFFPILNNNLIVCLKTESEETIIDKNSISNIVQAQQELIKSEEEDRLTFDKNQLISLFAFTEWAIELNDAEYACLTALKPENQPRWDERLWQNNNLEDLIAKFESDGRIAFKVPIKYHLKEPGEVPKTCWFKVFLEKDDALKNPEDHFIRENITIIDVKSLETSGVRGIVLIEDKQLANLLGDSENPAHTQWQEDSQNFVNKYYHGDKCIGFIKKILQRIYIKLQKPATGLDKEILKDLFFIETNTTDNKPVKPDDDSDKDDETEKPIINIETRNKGTRVKCSKIEGGIIIYPDNKDSNSVETIFVKVAYRTTRGKAFSKYLPYDFELNKNPIEVINTNCELRNCRENKLEVFNIDKDFELIIKGFDKKRDLVVDIKPQLTEHD
jgi:hypothetical protein